MGSPLMCAGKGGAAVFDSQFSKFAQAAKEASGKVGGFSDIITVRRAYLNEGAWE